MPRDDEPFRRMSAAPEWVGPAGSMVDVSNFTDRALLLKCYNELLIMQDHLGRFLTSHSTLAKRVSKLERKDSRDEDEITLVRDLRLYARRMRRWVYVSIGAIIVTIITGYICMKLGIRLPI